MKAKGEEDLREWLHKLIGSNVKKLRVQKGMSQLELSYALGLKSVSLVSKAEIGLERKHFNLEHLAKIAQILEVDIREFFCGWKPFHENHPDQG